MSHTAVVSVQVQHLDLKAAHEQLRMTLEDHKSALSAAQVPNRVVFCLFLYIITADFEYLLYVHGEDSSEMIKSVFILV